MTEVQDFVFLIMNCEKYRDKALKQKSTWLPQLPSFLIYYHVLGAPLLTNDFVFDDEQHILYVKAEDDYNSLPKKVIKAYEAVKSRFQFKYIFKTDDDQMVKKPQVFETFKNVILQKEAHYGGYIIDVKQPHYSEYNRIHPELPNRLPILPTRYCSGRFYFLSHEAVDDLIGKKALIKNEYLEDYAIGFHLKRNLKENMLFVDTNKVFKDF